MKKSFVAIVLGALIFATAACGTEEKSKTEIGSPLTIERTETTSMSASDCSEVMDLVQEGLDSISDAIPTLQSEAEVKSYLTTAKSFINTSIESIEQCAYLAPAEASSLISSLNRVDDAIDDVLGSY